MSPTLSLPSFSLWQTTAHRTIIGSRTRGRNETLWKKTVCQAERQRLSRSAATGGHETGALQRGKAKSAARKATQEVGKPTHPAALVVTRLSAPSSSASTHPYTDRNKVFAARL